MPPRMAQYCVLASNPLKIYRKNIYRAVLGFHEFNESDDSDREEEEERKKREEKQKKLEGLRKQQRISQLQEVY